MKNIIAKQKWILKYISNDFYRGVDVLNVSFVDAYISKFTPTYRETNYGARKCAELGSLLSSMYYLDLLDRKIFSLPHFVAGFPKWVYTYFLEEAAVSQGKKLGRPKKKT